MRYVMEAKRLWTFVSDVVQSYGLQTEHAAAFADNLVNSNLRGVDTHGVMRLQLYAAQMDSGSINCNCADIRILSDHPATSLIDGAGCPGFVVAERAMQKAIEKAKVCGIGLSGVRNSNHFGATAVYAMRALPYNMVGIACTNTRAMLAPFGGAERGLGNNPVAIAIPAGEYGSVVLDMAMSVAAGGKIHMAAKENLPIPLGWVVDKDGNPSTDPLDFTDETRGGSLVAFGGHKGSGLAFIVDLLAGAMTGPLFGMNVQAAFSKTSPSNMGNLFIAVNVSNFVDTKEFKKRVDDDIRALKKVHPAAGTIEVLFPGEPEQRCYEQRVREGIPLSENVVRDLVELGDKRGVNFMKTVEPREIY